MGVIGCDDSEGVDPPPVGPDDMRCQASPLSTNYGGMFFLFAQLSVPVKKICALTSDGSVVATACVALNAEPVAVSGDVNGESTVTIMLAGADSNPRDEIIFDSTVPATGEIIWLEDRRRMRIKDLLISNDIRIFPTLVNTNCIVRERLLELLEPEEVELVEQAENLADDMLALALDSAGQSDN